jgi:hypothetical protein
MEDNSAKDSFVISFAVRLWRSTTEKMRNERHSSAAGIRQLTGGIEWGYGIIKWR